MLRHVMLCMLCRHNTLQSMLSALQYYALHTQRSPPYNGLWTACHNRKGTNGVSTNGAMANFMFFDRDFLGTPANLLLSSPKKCQGVACFPIRQNPLLLQRAH